MRSLAAKEVRALHDALDDEYKAFATYDQVIGDFGAVRPFIKIRDSEARHIAALDRLFLAYGLPVPANPWPGKVPRYTTLRDACEAGVAAEVENAALYDRLLIATSRPDILAVFRNLREASQERHLEAFRRCAGRPSDGAGCAGGRRKREGRGCRAA